jgi:hypothetical protein
MSKGPKLGLYFIGGATVAGILGYIGQAVGLWTF